MLIRVSVLLFTARMILSRSFHLIMKILIVFSVLHGFTIILEALLICHPLSAAWDQSAGGKCANEVASYIALETIGLLIDLTILAIPIPSIFGMRIPTRRKIAIVGVFSMGAVYVNRPIIGPLAYKLF